MMCAAERDGYSYVIWFRSKPVTLLCRVLRGNKYCSMVSSIVCTVPTCPGDRVCPCAWWGWLSWRDARRHVYPLSPSDEGMRRTLHHLARDERVVSRDFRETVVQKSQVPNPEGRTAGSFHSSTFRQWLESAAGTEGGSH